MQRSVKVGRFVSLEYLPHHLIDEPPIHAFIKMRRLEIQPKHSKHQRQHEDCGTGRAKIADVLPDPLGDASRLVVSRFTHEREET